MQKAGKGNPTSCIIKCCWIRSEQDRVRSEQRRALNLIRDIQFDVIRGNISEIKTLAAGHGTTSGVDADEAEYTDGAESGENDSFIKDFPEGQVPVIAVTGGIDLISDAKRCFVIRNGRPGDGTDHRNRVSAFRDDDGIPCGESGEQSGSSCSSGLCHGACR